MGNHIGIDQEFNGGDSASVQQDLATDSRTIPDQYSRSSRSHRSSKNSKSHVRLIPLSGSPNTGLSCSLPNMSFQRSNGDQAISSQGVYHVTPTQSRTNDEMTEEEQIKMDQRLGYIQHLPRNTWNESQMSTMKVRECCICMIDFEQDEPIRYLPCMHYYHVDCIDDWLMRSFTCPTCLEPVDAALLSTYGSQSLEDLS